MVFIRTTNGRDLRLVRAACLLADEVILNDIVLRDIPNMEFNVVAGRFYTFYILIYAIGGSANPDIKYSITTPAGETRLGYQTAFGTPFTVITRPYNAALSSTLDTVEEAALFAGDLAPTTSGVIHLQCAQQNIDPVNATTILQATSLMAYETG